MFRGSEGVQSEGVSSTPMVFELCSASARWVTVECSLMANCLQFSQYSRKACVPRLFAPLWCSGFQLPWTRLCRGGAGGSEWSLDSTYSRCCCFFVHGLFRGYVAYSHGASPFPPYKRCQRLHVELFRGHRWLRVHQVLITFLLSPLVRLLTPPPPGIWSTGILHVLIGHQLGCDAYS